MAAAARVFLMSSSIPRPPPSLRLGKADVRTCFLQTLVPDFLPCQAVRWLHTGSPGYKASEEPVSDEMKGVSEWIRRKSLKRKKINEGEEDMNS